MRSVAASAFPVFPRASSAVKFLALTQRFVNLSLPHFYMNNKVFFCKAVFSWMHTQEFPELTAMGSLGDAVQSRAVLPIGTGLVRMQQGHYLG